jgi:endonuclease G, mitochondrial
MAKKKKLPLWVSVLFVVVAVLLDWLGFIELGEDDGAPDSVPSGAPVADVPASGSSGHLLGEAPRGAALTRLDRIGYSVGYDEDRANPAWVGYHLVGLPQHEAGDRPGFRTDTQTDSQIKTGDYTRSGYSRGHMAPNYAIASYYGVDAQTETFLMSNIIPQLQGLNGGAWRALEENIPGPDGYADTLGEVWVVTGPLYSGRVKTLNDADAVDIPSDCYMIVVDEDGGGYRAMAFIFPQEPPDDYDLADFLTTIDDIEDEADLDFFPGLPGEAALESAQAASVW